MNTFLNSCDPRNLGIQIVVLLMLHAPSVPVVAQTTRGQEPRERAIELFTKGDTKGAVSVLTEVVRQDKGDAVAWRYLGLALNKDGDVKGARKAFESALKLRDDDAIAHTGLAYTFLLANNTSSAKREANRALELAGPNAEVHYIIGLAWLRERNSSRALEEGEIATKIDPNYSRGFLLTSEALVETYLQYTFRDAGLGHKETDREFERDREIFRRAAESLSKCLALNPKAPEADNWREQIGIMRSFARPLETHLSKNVFLGSQSR